MTKSFWVTLMSLMTKLFSGTCIYCNQQTSFLRKSHPECAAKHFHGAQQITSDVFNALNDVAHSLIELEHKILSVETTCFISPIKKNNILVEGWENAVKTILHKGQLTESEGNHLSAFIKHFSLSQSDLDKHGHATQLLKLTILQHVRKGDIPNVNRVGDCSVNLQKNEKIVWVFNNSKYYEYKTRRQYVGGSRGVSVRVMKGVSYKVGSFKGHTISQTELAHVGNGGFFLTDKNVYFVSSTKSIRIPYKKIVSFEPYSDGIIINRDAATATPQIFITGDGWFTYNLATNLAQLVD